MVVLLQRVREASVEVDGQITGAIGRGLLLFLGVHRSDDGTEIEWLARKCANVRVFPDEEGVMNCSVRDIGGQVLVVSQFTLYASTRKGNRPSFMEAARPLRAEALYQQFITSLNSHLSHPVATGIFGAAMKVHLVGDGPVTLWIERRGTVTRQSQ